MGKKPKTHFRAVFISDVHLGTKDCQVEKLLAFLSAIQCEYLYLAGDIVDVWALRRKWFWPTTHSNVVRKLLKRDIKGTHITYVPGNHDEIFRDYHGLEFGGVKIVTQARHTLLDGRTLMVMHGDEFDAVVTNAKLITAVGDWLYYVLLFCNRVVNHLRRRLGFGYWSLAGYIKDKVKSVLQFVGNYEKCVAKCAREKKVDVIVCGHIHRPEIREMDGVTYCNCGDWVENCTAIVETLEGKLELVNWANVVTPDEAAQAEAQAETGHEIPELQEIGAGGPRLNVSSAHIKAVLANDALAAMVGSRDDLADLPETTSSDFLDLPLASPAPVAGSQTDKQTASSSALMATAGTSVGSSQQCP